MVNTFVTCDDFEQVAKSLDNRRCGKQRLEARQILRVLESLRVAPEKKVAWGSHPAVRMWIGYERALKLYFNAMVREWISRGFKNTLPLEDPGIGSEVEMPWWLGCKILHRSHQASLLRKDPEYYLSRFGDAGEFARHGYVWPGKLNPDQRSKLIRGEFDAGLFYPVRVKNPGIRARSVSVPVPTPLKIRLVPKFPTVPVSVTVPTPLKIRLVPKFPMVSEICVEKGLAQSS
ncbi:MAG: pyrimidine dimer DNA glycosylase/endonuclease V [Sulfobacillus sp.]